MLVPLLVIDANGELDLFRTPETMSNLLEAVEVRDGECRVFDCAGFEYAAWAETDSSPVLVGPTIGQDLEVVRDLAMRFIARLPPSRAEIADRGELVTAAAITRALLPFAR